MARSTVPLAWGCFGNAASSVPGREWPGGDGCDVPLQIFPRALLSLPLLLLCFRSFRALSAADRPLIVMKRLCLTVSLCGVLLSTPISGQSKPVLTWNRHVAPIMVRYCAPCHAPGGLASVRLMTYETARPLAASIMSRLMTRSMPPRATEPPLPEQDARTVITWVTSGAVRGELDAADRDPAGVWTLRVGSTSRAVVLVERQGARLRAKVGPSERELRAADSFRFEDLTMVLKDGDVVYTLNVDGATALGSVEGSGGTDPVSGTKASVR